jgi:GNAT superfamily N-acetyltransferase
LGGIPEVKQFKGPPHAALLSFREVKMLSIEIAAPDDAETVAQMVKALLEEIMAATGTAHFKADPAELRARCREFLQQGAYTVWLAREGKEWAGFVALTEACALYAGGAFGLIPEFYVSPEFRSRGVGAALLAAAREHGKARGWTRLEVTTPPLPEFERTLRFYAANGFEVAGGRKLRALL